MNWMTSAKKRIYKSKSSKEHQKRLQASRKLNQQKEMMHKEFYLLQTIKDHNSDHTHSKKRSIDDALLNNSSEYINKVPQILNKTFLMNQPTHNSSQPLQSSSVNPDNNPSSLHVINQQIDMFEFSSQESTLPSYDDQISKGKMSYPKSNSSILFINDGKIVDNLSMKSSIKEEEIEERYLPLQETKPMLADVNLLTPLEISHTWNLFEGELIQTNYPKALCDQFMHSKSKNKTKEQLQERYLVHSDEELDPSMFLK